MKKLVLISLITFIFVSGCKNNKSSEGFEFSSKFLKININNQGHFTGFIDQNSNTNYLSIDTIAPLLSIHQNDSIFTPISANLREDFLNLSYTNGIEAKIKIEEKENHLTFEIINIEPNDNVELVVWGPYPTNLNTVIGETVGVVQGEDFALGLQSLNTKTLGGYPWNNNDAMPQIDIFEQDDLTDMKEVGKRGVLYRVEAAKPTSYGSSLQAYTRNRFEDRLVKNLNHDRYIAPAFDDGGTIGSKIALFGAPVKDALATIGEIELLEGLPHPLINGEWAKTSSAASSAYLIMGFGVDDIQKALDLTKKAGLNYLYHPGPFETWGKFKLNKKQFPKGIESFKTCVEIAKAQGITLGLHTLSNFITTNDPYVTPVPDKRLALVGSSTITTDINKDQNTITIESPDFFNQFNNNHLKTIRIGDELIRYGSVSKTAPWTLIDCQRGAFETKATSHKNGTVIGKLIDHGYKVFLTNTEMSVEVAKTLADIYNQTGLRQISFDGLEGNRSTGMGNYGEILFTQSWYDNLSEDIRSNYIADASRTSHYFWHMYTRMNWGEPWYAGFRESQTEYRLKNQKYFKRNLMPAMLGWFKLTPNTSIEDVEWLLARSAAFDAGYAFAASYEDVAKNKHSDQIMKLIGEWEELRLNRSFSLDQKLRMEDITNEFSLFPSERAEKKSRWNLRQIYSNKFKHAFKVRQPGEPLFSNFEFEHPGKEQTLEFILTATDSDVSKITLELDNYKTIVIPTVLKSGQVLKYKGGSEAVIFDSNWNEIRKIKIDSSALKITQGPHNLTVDAQFKRQSDQSILKVETRTMGEIELVGGE